METCSCCGDRATTYESVGALRFCFKPACQLDATDLKEHLAGKQQGVSGSTLYVEKATPDPPVKVGGQIPARGKFEPMAGLTKAAEDDEPGEAKFKPLAGLQKADTDTTGTQRFSVPGG